MIHAAWTKPFDRHSKRGWAKKNQSAMPNSSKAAPAEQNLQIVNFAQKVHFKFLIKTSVLSAAAYLSIKSSIPEFFTVPLKSISAVFSSLLKYMYYKHSLLYWTIFISALRVTIQSVTVFMYCCEFYEKQN